MADVGLIQDLCYSQALIQPRAQKDPTKTHLEGQGHSEYSPLGFRGLMSDPYEDTGAEHALSSSKSKHKPLGSLGTLSQMQRGEKLLCHIPGRGLRLLQ